MNVPICSYICASSGIPIPWVSELRYLGICILKSRSFKCSLSIHRKAFYCWAKCYLWQSRSHRVRSSFATSQ